MSCHQQTFIHRRRLGPSRSPSCTTTLSYHCPTLTDCQVCFKPRIVNDMANLNLMEIMIFYCLQFTRAFEFRSTYNLMCPTGSIDWQAFGCLLNTLLNYEWCAIPANKPVFAMNCFLLLPVSFWKHCLCRTSNNKRKIYTTLGYIVSLILLNLEHVFRFRIVSRMC